MDRSEPVPTKTIHPDDPRHVSNHAVPVRARPPIEPEEDTFKITEGVQNGVSFVQVAAVNELQPQISENTMTMSHDRVNFKLDFANADRATRVAFRKAFGHHIERVARRRMSQPNPPNIREIICRPSQFARFLIYRKDEGGQNMFRVLEAVLFTPEPPKTQPLDVSMNPAIIFQATDEGDDLE